MPTDQLQVSGSGRQDSTMVLGPILLPPQSTAAAASATINLTASDRANYVQPPREQALTRGTIVQNILSLSKTSPFEKHQMIVEAIWQDLNDRGVIYREIVDNPNKDVPGLYLHETGRSVVDLSGRLLNPLLVEYGLQHDALLSKVRRHIFDRAERHGTPVRVVPSYFYDESTYTLYANLGNDNILRLKATSADLVANGSDGILFPPYSSEPLDLDLDAIRASRLGMRIEPSSLAYDYFNASFDDEFMAAEHWHQLTVSRILALFFPEAFNSRSLLAFIGEAGCGKTILAQKTGWALEGERFQVDAIVDDPKEMESLLTTKSFVVLDNCDNIQQMKKQTSLLCRVCTGGRVSRKVLYTTNDHIEYPLVSNIILTAVSGGFFRDTLASRTLIIPFKPRDRNAASGGHNFQRQAPASRNALMTEMFGRAKNILAALEAQAAYLAMEDSRLQDLTGFIMRCAIHEGWASLGTEILTTMTDTQNSEAHLNNPIHRAIELYIGGAHPYGIDYDQPIKMTALAHRLHAAAQSGGINLQFEAHAFNMRSKIASQFSTLERKFGLRRKNNRSHSHDYWFEPTSEVLAQCRELTSQISMGLRAQADLHVEDI